ncbi:MAG: Dynamin family protein, partial [Atribacterota bacterium]
QGAREHFRSILKEHLADRAENPEARIQEVFDREVPAFFERELSKVVRVFETKVTEALKPYEQRIHELTEAVRKKAAELFDIPCYVSRSSEVFAVEKKPYWVTHKWYTHFHLLPEGFLATLLPEKTRRAKLRQRMEKEIEELVTTNVENLRWATLQNLDQTFRQFVATINEHLERTVSATQGAIERVRSKKAEESQNVAWELEKLRRALKRLQALQEQLSMGHNLENTS